MLAHALSIASCGECILWDTLPVIAIVETQAFVDWIERLSDNNARARIFTRIMRLAAGNPGDVRPVGQGVSELRIDFGPAYRVYFVRRGRGIVILLGGGDKRTQDRDIAAAIASAAKL